MAWQDALAGIFGESANALGRIDNQRKVAVEQQLRQRQFESQDRTRRVAEFGTKFDALQPDTDVDPELLKEAATLGFSSMFKKTPDGRIRRQETLTDQLNKLQVSTADLVNQREKYELQFASEKADPAVYARLITMPRQQREVEAQRLGLRTAPLTDSEKRDDLEMELRYNPMYRTYQEGLRLANTRPGSGRANGGGYEIPPSVITGLTKGAEASAKEQGGLFNTVRGWFGAEPSTGPATQAFEAQKSLLLNNFPALAVDDAKKLIAQQPGLSPEEYIQIARQFPGFDQNDASVLLPILNILAIGGKR